MGFIEANKMGKLKTGCGDLVESIKTFNQTNKIELDGGCHASPVLEASHVSLVPEASPASPACLLHLLVCI